MIDVLRSVVWGQLVRGGDPRVVHPVPHGRDELFELSLHLIDAVLLRHQRIIQLPHGIALECQVRFQGINPLTIGIHIILPRSEQPPVWRRTALHCLRHPARFAATQPA